MTLLALGGSLIAFAIVFNLLNSSIRRKGQNLPLPPGPPGLPIFGNLLDLPSPDQPEWEFYSKHKDLYGPISSLNILGTNIIILNDVRLAVELFEKRSVIYSSRPDVNSINMSGWGGVLGARANMSHVRTIRTHFHQQIGSNRAVSGFDEIQKEEVAHFLLRLLNTPQDLDQHIRKQAGGVILKIAYGYTVEPHGPDPLVDLADNAMHGFGLAFLPTWPVNFIPFLKHAPSWFPGASFNKIAKEVKEHVTGFTDVPWNFVKQQIKSGDCNPSFLSIQLQIETPKPGSEDETVLKWSAASMYAGGADTTTSTFLTFFLAMALFPEVQRKAQEEIDAVVGKNQLPTFQHRENLPYINALLKEALRWHPVVPINISHVSTQDDICEGYFIPKGSSIYANIWGFTRNPNVYPDPTNFNPDRFLASEGHLPERDPHMLVFGFGRRACPGRTLADSNIFLAIAQTLAVFNISRPIRDGKPQKLEAKFLPATISHAAPYEVSIQPRSAEHRQLIQSLEGIYPWEPSSASLLLGKKE